MGEINLVKEWFESSVFSPTVGGLTIIGKSFNL